MKAKKCVPADKKCRRAKKCYYARRYLRRHRKHVLRRFRSPKNKLKRSKRVIKIVRRCNRRRAASKKPKCQKGRVGRKCRFAKRKALLARKCAKTDRKCRRAKKCFFNRRIFRLKKLFKRCKKSL